ncbi:Mini-ribonuclease 3 [Aerococcus sp. 1KP-2016]|uniref:Mini-ribonuclease 3 n=1 Tax=Aerococcus sp. 1KP-2016 TaxID=1981982 RepID=UPI000B99B7EC|nr:Mini-ribonuclease 3 [Aerococcus sp. 1KP-2016]OYQ67382.1 ribonuclease III [Aerococcus sp. 1KP-2016]
MSEYKSLSTNQINQLSGLTLAYLGDASWEVVVRSYLVNQGLTKPKDLHKAATSFVSAKGQAAFIELMENTPGFLTEDEITIYKRGRNAKSHSSAKNADIHTYRIATGFEALMGYVYLTDKDRFDTITQFCIDHIDQAQGNEEATNGTK